MGTINQEDQHLVETLNTLNFISKAKRIRINPKMNFKTRDDSLKDLKIQELLQSVSHLEAENENLKKHVQIERQKSQEFEGLNLSVIKQNQEEMKEKIMNLEKSLFEGRERWETEGRGLREEISRLQQRATVCESEVWESDLDKTVVVKKRPQSERKKIGKGLAKKRENSRHKRENNNNNINSNNIRAIEGYRQAKSVKGGRQMEHFRANSGHRRASTHDRGDYFSKFSPKKQRKLREIEFEIEHNFEVLLKVWRVNKGSGEGQLKGKRSVSRRRAEKDNFSRKVRSFSRKRKSAPVKRKNYD